MTNEEREAIRQCELYVQAKATIQLTDEINDRLVFKSCDTSAIDTVLSLIKGQQTEIEIYKEELDSIYKALDIERGVARPRTYEIIQALKNTIKSQAKQIENTKVLYDRALSDLVKADKQIDLMAEYWQSGLAMCENCDKIVKNFDENKCKDCIKQYFERKVENVKD